jgi:hypothetical protein
VAEVVIVDDDAAGLPAMVGGLIAAAIEDPGKARILDSMKGTVTIVIPDADAEIGLRFSGGVCRVHGAPIPGSTIRIEASADRLFGLSSAPMIFGLPSPFAAAGRDLTKQILRREIRFSGIRHVTLLRQLTALLSTT